MLQIFEKKSEMNSRVMALRDSKVEIVSQLQAQVEQLQEVQQHLPPEKRRPPASCARLNARRDAREETQIHPGHLGALRHS